MNRFRLLSLFVLLLLHASMLHAQSQTSFQVVVKGNGKENVLLIPGFTCPGKVWDATVAQLEKKYTCHIITFAGFAGQPAQTDPHLKQWVDDLATYIRTAHLGKPVIIGHSIGGGIALMLASQYPDLPAKIIVVDALPCLGAVQNPAFKANPNADCSVFVNRYTNMSDSALRVMQERTVPQLCANQVMQPEIVSWSLQSDRKTMGQIYCEFMNTDQRNTLSTIQCPAIVLLEASFKTYADAMEQQYAGLKNKQIAYAGKGLHFIMYDDPEWYLQQINNSLK